ncbi:isoflavone 7-O-methyltransferase isoform X2 [Arachis ipaensis]|uniref:isoflavone 7-O-methyltransferase isoform X2 n=1 Tax=Arachis ipaensis TaxID=130454 RepID=UPI000A2B0BC2|nr:isoflavone 7-O-methyltransferase isoform X2 [Arachis ipaensis]
MELLSECKASEIFEGQVVVYKHLYAYLDSMCLKWCLDLNMPDIIHNHGQPITLHHLASTLQVPPSKIDGVRRFMRHLAHNGFFHITRLLHDDNEEKEAYALTIASKLLVKGTQHSLAPMSKCVLDPTLSGSNNLSFVGGDMFLSIPHAHAILLKWILHDWDDEHCVKILKKCKDAILNDVKGGKVIIIDTVINENHEEHELTQLKLRMDIMMTHVNGKERSQEELKKLFLKAGFQNYKISPLTGIYSLIEVYP